MGALVQPPPAARTNRRHPTSRTRTSVLSAQSGHRLTQANRPPENTGRFSESNAQDVGTLLNSNWQLPQTVEDGRVLSRVFDAIDAVQTVCPQSLVDSLSEQGALAA